MRKRYSKDYNGPIWQAYRQLRTGVTLRCGPICSKPRFLRTPSPSFRVRSGERRRPLQWPPSVRRRSLLWAQWPALPSRDSILINDAESKSGNDWEIKKIRSCSSNYHRFRAQPHVLKQQCVDVVSLQSLWQPLRDLVSRQRKRVWQGQKRSGGSEKLGCRRMRSLWRSTATEKPEKDGRTRNEEKFGFTFPTFETETATKVTWSGARCNARARAPPPDFENLPSSWNNSLLRRSAGWKKTLVRTPRLVQHTLVVLSTLQGVPRLSYLIMKK